MKLFQRLFLLFSVFLFVLTAYGQQGFLHADGQKIVDGNGQNVLLRGMGMGGWMLQEGYMMQSSGFANTQHQLKVKIEQVAGTDGLNAFYDAWLMNYCTKADIDSMAAMGFNSIRLPMHYNLFTLPIEEEPVEGQDTWLDKGFEMVDQLLEWCEADQVYLILDLHAAPGGQGKDEAISDYDPSKPSLWESAENRRKTVALWKKLAERYVDEPWIGGYDLLNETNWTMSNNSLLKNLYAELTEAIREVDQNHLIFIEGNWFANDFTGLTPPWDDNMAYSFHKYWSYNNQGSIQWMLDIRKNYDVPIWLGESGENSNVWFTNAIDLFEKNNIGWAWWPYKKIGSVQGTVTIPKTEGYQKLLNYWDGNGSKPSAEDAKTWLLEQAEMLKLENCVVHSDVLDAMFRQAQGDRSSKPFKEHTLPGTIFASDYDLGGNSYAYYDVDSADYHVSTDNYTSWNQGYAYRNDAVDIEDCSDETSNGYSVGWTSTGEWMKYTIKVDSSSAYNLDFRYAANGSSGEVHFELDDVPICKKTTLPSTGGWSTWQSIQLNDLVMETGEHQLKLFIDNAGFNINYLQFELGKSLAEVTPKVIFLKTDENGNDIQVISNVGFNENSLPTAAEFTLKIDNAEVGIDGVEVDSMNYKVLLLKSTQEMILDNRITLAYSGTSLESPSGISYDAFGNTLVENLSPDYVVVPARIQAEDYVLNNGFELEDCTDSGGGSNLAYANPGDYADYHIYSSEETKYEFTYRVASQNSGRFKVQVITNEGTSDLHTISVGTGGWQSWENESATATLPKGKSTLRIYVLSGEYNLNWFRISVATGTDLSEIGEDQIFFSSIDGTSTLVVHNRGNIIGKSTIEIYDLSGRKRITKELMLSGDAHQNIEGINLRAGGYIVKFKNNGNQKIQKLWIR